MFQDTKKSIKLRWACYSIYEISKYLNFYVINYFRALENPFLISNYEFTIERFRFTKVCVKYIISKVRSFGLR